MSKTQELQKLLRNRLLANVHAADQNYFSGGIFLTEVTHLQHRSRADVLFIGMTNQSGRRLDGYEIKISRGDWLRELRSPTKADAWADECQSWTIVADEGVVKVEELPEGFGLLERRERKTVRLVQVVKPRIRENRVPSWDAMFSIMSAVEREKRKSIDEVKKKAAQEYSDIHTLLIKEQQAKAPSRVNEKAVNVLTVLESAFGAIADPQDTSNLWGGLDINELVEKMKPFLESETKISRLVGSDYYGVVPTLKQAMNHLHLLQEAIEKIGGMAEQTQELRLKD